MIAKAGQVPFSYKAFDNQAGLFLQAQVYDITVIGTPALLTTVNLTDLSNGQYVGEFTGVAGKNYGVSIIPYTDGTYGTVDNNRSGSDAVIQCIDVAGSEPDNVGFETVLLSEQIESVLEAEFIETVLIVELLEAI